MKSLRGTGGKDTYKGRPSGHGSRARRGAAAWEALTLFALLVIIVGSAYYLVRSGSPADMHGRTVRHLELVCEALTKYALDNGGVFPTTAQGLQALLEEPTKPLRPVNWRGPYLDDEALLRDAWGREFHYVAPATGDPPRPYDVWSLGADNQEGGKGADADIESRDRTTLLPLR